MRYLYPCIEQLDRAADELRYANPLHSRLALVFIDNVVELIIYRKCRSLLEKEAYETTSPEVALLAAQKKLRYASFPDVLNELFRRDVINGEERDLVRIAHEYRNAAYHEGLTRDDVIHPIAWHYHAIACELFWRLHPRSFEWRPDDPITPRVRKHLNDAVLLIYERRIGERLGSHPILRWLRMQNKKLELKESRRPEEFGSEELRAVAGLISNERPALGTTLEILLADTISASLARIENEIQFLVSSPLAPFDWRLLVSRIALPTEEDWISHLKDVPISSWRARVANLRGERRAARALEQYEGILRGIGEYAKKIRASAGYLADFLEWELGIVRRELA